MSSERSFYAFGPFRLDPADRLLWRDAQVVTLTPKAIELLLLFADSGGRVLAKDDLMKRLWPDTFVEEANLSHHVYKIRDALGEPPDGWHLHRNARAPGISVRRAGDQGPAHRGVVVRRCGAHD